MGDTNRKFRFQVGDQVVFLYGPRWMRGEIVENRGPLGAYGEQIYLVQTTLDSEEPVAFEIPEQSLKESGQEGTQEGPPGVRKGFKVSYTRKARSDTWRARTKPGRRYKGLRIKGAVAYTAAPWGGETRDDEKHGTVTVFLEPDAYGNEETMVEDARRLADEMFKRWHPKAVIEHKAETRVGNND